MLQNQSQEETPNALSAGAAGRRVTPEELTAALAALETRKEDEALRIRGTVPIGEAVQELGLDATPDEIWEQVQAQRAKSEQAVTSPPGPPKVPKAPEANLADAVNETLHGAAQQAHKLAGQASAAAAASLAVAQAAKAQRERRASQGRRRDGGAFATVMLLLGLGVVWLSGGHNIVVGGNHETGVYAGSRQAATVAGDHDTITLGGDCGTLLMLGDDDHVTVTGTARRIIVFGDRDTVTWAGNASAGPPSIINLGDGNHINQAVP